MKRCLGGCSALISAGSYCPRCRPRNGSTRQWRSVRDEILARDHWQCQYCGGPAQHVDHAVPVAHGGTDHEANLVAACRGCNLRKGTDADLRPVA